VQFDRERGMFRWLCPVVMLALAAPALADDDDHDRARAAVERGAILTLNRILEVAARDTPGRVSDVSLDEDDGRYVYEVEIIGRGGQIVEMKIDAASGRILEREIDD